MDYHTIFVATEKPLEWWPILGSIGFLIVFAAVGWQGHRRRARNQMILGFSLSAVSLLFLVLIVWFVGGSYLEAARVLKSGDFKVVEGPVEDFHPMPWAGHDLESFSVGGIPFAYSDYKSTAGFNNTSSHGGPIRAGAWTRISFYSKGSSSVGENNVILKLELRVQ
jgi:Trk-type K+ transport system membrane component